jgi:hypothetical protein
MGPVIFTSRQPRRRRIVSFFTCLFSFSLLCVFLLRRIMYYLVVTFSVTIDWVNTCDWLNVKLGSYVVGSTPKKSSPGVLEEFFSHMNISNVHVAKTKCSCGYNEIYRAMPRGKMFMRMNIGHMDISALSCHCMILSHYSTSSFHPPLGKKLP